MRYTYEEFEKAWEELGELTRPGGGEAGDLARRRFVAEQDIDDVALRLLSRETAATTSAWALFERMQGDGPLAWDPPSSLFLTGFLFGWFCSQRRASAVFFAAGEEPCDGSAECKAAEHRLDCYARASS